MNRFRGVDALLVPQRCVLCRRRVASDAWCETCRDSLQPAQAACYRCGSARQGSHNCWPAGVAVASTTVAYTDSLPLRRGLANATRHGVMSVFDEIASQLAARYLIRDRVDTVVCAVPIRRRAQRIQPFDQRRRLASMFAEGARLPLGPVFGWSPRWQERGGAQPDVLVGRYVVLVTDVIHSGVVLSQVVELVDDAGAKRVDVVAVARYGDFAFGASVR